MGFQSVLLSTLFFLIFFSPLLLAQQPYIRQSNLNCDKTDPSASDLGYACNGQNPSCQAYLIFRSQPPYDSVSSISELLGSDPSQLSQVNSVSLTSNFPIDKEVVVPVNCSCSGNYSQVNSSHVIVAGATYFSVANNTYQGLSTCQAIQDQNSFSSTDLSPGQVINVPLRCACPTRNQSSDGVRYLLSYLVISGDSVSAVSEAFQVEPQSTLDANGLSFEDSTIYPYTTLLVPLLREPSSSQIVRPPPPPPSPTGISLSSDGNKSTKAWVYVVIGLAVGALVLIASAFLLSVYCRKKRRKANLIPTSDHSENDKKTEETELPDDLSDEISLIGQTLKVYKLEELKIATDNFSSKCNLGGSVYRGVIKGDLAAIKKMDGDVSEEIELLKKINHFNLVRLSGVCFSGGHWYLVYEFAENGPLDDWIHSGDDSKTLSWMHRVQIALDVANGLNYIHSYAQPGYVHKDIRSRNILLDDNFRAKIANFSMVRSAKGQDGGFALTRHIVGTKGYLAPEYLENGLVSPKLDVYAFGVVMLEIITGREAVIAWGGGSTFLADALVDVLSKENAKDDLIDFLDPSLRGDYPLDLALVMARLIEGCLKKDPECRPSMDEVVQSLGRILAASLSSEFSSYASESKSFSTDVEL